MQRIPRPFPSWPERVRSPKGSVNAKYLPVFRQEPAMKQEAKRTPRWPGRPGVLVIALASVMAMAWVVAAVSARANEKGLDTARLTNLVREDCGSCHGLTLKGGLGKPLTPDHLRAWSHEQIVAIILDGVPGTPMPPWRPLLSEAEVQWIAERLQKGDLQ